MGFGWPYNIVYTLFGTYLPSAHGSNASQGKKYESHRRPLRGLLRYSCLQSYGELTYRKRCVMMQPTAVLIVILLKISRHHFIYLGSFVSESFFPIFRHFFAQFLNLSYFPVFFSKYWNVNELGIFGYGEFHEQRQNASVY